jgi:hypothetical protein
MSSLTNNLTRGLALLCLCLTLVSCQDTIPARSTISASTGTPVPTCATGETLNTTTNLCEPTVITRPTGAIKFKSDYCICNATKPVSYGNCATFCSTKNVTVDTLYANFTVTEAISLSGLGNVGAWCKTPLSTDTAQPNCVVKAKDDDGNEINLQNLSIAVGSNSLTAEAQNLSADKTYVLTLVEEISAAKSDSVQVIKFTTATGPSTLGPLKQQLVNQYTCLARTYSTVTTTTGSASTTTYYYNNAYRLHFYFTPRYMPASVNAGNLFCHDTVTYGTTDDSATIPRLELIEGIYNLWDTSDPRFFDNNGNNIDDVNDMIFDKTRNFGGTIPTGTKFFANFKWPGAPTLSTDAGNSNSSSTTSATQTIGWYMAPWIDTTTYKSYCLTNTQYNSSNPLFQAMRDVLQVETEGLYVGEKAAETVVTTVNGVATTTTGYKDYILIREADLKVVWFYMKNGTPTAPTEDNVANNSVYFYYPLNKASPFVKSSTQKMYQVKGAAELNSTSSTTTTSTATATSSGSSSSYPPHDRKIGCIPKF